MHTFSSYIALGDSFTEGLNDYLPDDTFLGWADRLAAMLAEGQPDFKYANLALRGRRLQTIIDEQLPVALELEPDLVTVCAGGNDILRPGADIDIIASKFDGMIERLRDAGIDVVVFAGPDTKQMSVVHRLRGKIAIYNESLRTTAARHGARLVDLWGMDALRDPQAWSEDRLHFTSEAHRRIALRTAEVLGAWISQDWDAPLHETDSQSDADTANWVSMRRADIEWTRAHVLPWIRRRMRRESMGDGLGPKRPELRPLGTEEYMQTATDTTGTEATEGGERAS